MYSLFNDGRHYYRCIQYFQQIQLVYIIISNNNCIVNLFQLQTKYINHYQHINCNLSTIINLSFFYNISTIHHISTIHNISTVYNMTTNFTDINSSLAINNSKEEFPLRATVILHNRTLSHLLNVFLCSGGVHNQIMSFSNTDGRTTRQQTPCNHLMQSI